MGMSLFNRFFLAFAALFFGAMPSFWALTVEQTLVLEPGGGMKASYVYEMPRAARGILAQLSREASGRIPGAIPNGGVLDGEAVRKQFAGIRGVYVENYSISPSSDKERVRVEFSVVALDAAGALASGAFGPFQYNPFGKEAAAGGVLTLTMPTEEERQGIDPAHFRRLAELLGGFDFSLKLTAPAATDKSTTGEPDGPNRRVWHLTLESLLAGPLPVVRLAW